MNKINVGGQAVIEGVMMRSPGAFAVAVRRPDSKIELSIRRWVSIWERLRFLRLPFLRGAIVLFETLYNGIWALNFSAKVSMPEEESKKETDRAIIFTMIVAFAFGLLLFVALPHYLTIFLSRLLGNELNVSNIVFHLLDGVIKIAIFLLYLYVISLMKDVRRVFMYHGAEHKSIFAYESGEELTIENARKYTTHHPRCGTSFLLIVLLVSIFVFALIFPFVPDLVRNKWINNAFMVLIKIILMFPIAGISYEFLKFSSKFQNNPLMRVLIYPGLLLQRITTKPPTDDMLEIAIISILAVLKEEERPLNEPRIMTFEGLEDFKKTYLAEGDPAQSISGH